MEPDLRLILGILVAGWKDTETSGFWWGNKKNPCSHYSGTNCSSHSSISRSETWCYTRQRRGASCLIPDVWRSSGRTVSWKRSASVWPLVKVNSLRSPAERCTSVLHKLQIRVDGEASEGPGSGPGARFMSVMAAARWSCLRESGLSDLLPHAHRGWRWRSPGYCDLLQNLMLLSAAPRPSSTFRPPPSCIAPPIRSSAHVG